MEEKKTIKISFTTFFLILSIIVIIVMGCYIYKVSSERNLAEDEINVLNQEISEMEKTTNNLQKKIDEISNTMSNDIKTNVTDNDENLVNQERCKQNFQKYLNISATFESDSINILKELKLVSEDFDLDTYNQGIEFNDVESWDMSHFTKTDIKYKQYKEKMEEYMTLECMKQNFSDYTRNDEGYLCVVDWGGTHLYQEVLKIEEAFSPNMYNIQVSTRAEDDGSKNTLNYIVKFDESCKVEKVKVK